MPLLCQMPLGIIPVFQQLENVELIFALCHVLQSLPSLLYAFYLGLKATKISRQAFSPAQPGGIKAQLNPLKFGCFHRHGGAQLSQALGRIWPTELTQQRHQCLVSFGCLNQSSVPASPRNIDKNFIPFSCS